MIELAVFYNKMCLDIGFDEDQDNRESVPNGGKKDVWDPDSHLCVAGVQKLFLVLPQTLSR